MPTCCRPKSNIATGDRKSHHLRMSGFDDLAVPVLKSVPERAFDAVQQQVSAFQHELSERMEIGVSINGARDIIHVKSIDLSGQMIVFDGIDNQGRRCRAIQHYTQVNIQMTAVDALNEQAHRIGF